MNQVTFNKLQLYAVLSKKRILGIKGLVEEGEYQFFLVEDFVEYNPSNNIHKNNLRRGTDLQSILSSSLEYDQDSLLTRIEEINEISIEFSNSYEWFIIR